MNTKQKVMVFIARPKNDDFEWLTRHNAPHPQHGGARWYIVTGNVDEGETGVQAAVREAKEETGISDVQKVIKLPIVSTYKSEFHPDVEFVEQAYLIITKHSSPVVLNEESDDYKWLSLDVFVAKIWWSEDRVELKKILTKYTSS